MSNPLKEDPYFRGLVMLLVWNQIQASAMTSLLQESGQYSPQAYNARFRQLYQDHSLAYIENAWKFLDTYADPEKREQAIWNSWGIGDQWRPSDPPADQK